MPSIVSGYAYDVFISYRQKDNRAGHWVTKFVNALRAELDSTFKEDVTIYFDENPNEGLLETHDVDDSVKEKLKCLIFIPIVSQTYCDPKSFAWEHEFKAFVAQASSDHFGLKIKLASGNVASRVLPVRVHELETDDIKLFESEIHCSMRPVDFVFKSAGVNRPLLLSDKREDNLSRTSYRDQVNKVANAIKDIVNGIKANKKSSRTKKEKKYTHRLVERIKPKSVKKFAYLATVVPTLALVSYYLAFRASDTPTASKSSIAVIPFRNNTGDVTKNVFGVGIASEVCAELTSTKQFNFISSLQSTIQYQQTNDSPKKIGTDLGVTHILSGVFQTAAQKIQVMVELVDSKTGNILWNLTYQTNYDDVFALQRGIAAKVMEKFSVAPSTANIAPTKNIEAYYHYMRGHDRVLRTNDAATWLKAIPDFKKAIALDSNFLAPWAEITDVYGFYFANEPQDSSVTIKVIEPYIKYIDSHFPDSSERKNALANYRFFFLGDLDGALKLLQEVLKENPDDPEANGQVSIIYRRKLRLEESVFHMLKQIRQSPTRLTNWGNLMGTFQLMGDLDNYEKVADRIYSLDFDNWRSLYFLRQCTNSLEKLPDRIIKEAGHQYDADFAFQKGDYNRVLKLMNASNEDSVFGISSQCYNKAIAHYLLKQDDSARYFSRLFFKMPPDKFSVGDVFKKRMMNSILKEEQKVFNEIALEFSRRNEKADLSVQWYEKQRKVFYYALSGQYKNATALLNSMNHDYPQVGWYQWLNLPLFYRIKKEYSPFAEATKAINYPRISNKNILN